MPFRQLLKSPYQYFKNRNGIFCELKLNLRWEQWSNILIWQLFENLPKIKYFLAYVNRSIGQTIKIILSVQDNFCQTFATVRRTFGMTAIRHLGTCWAAVGKSPVNLHQYPGNHLLKRVKWICVKNPTYSSIIRPWSYYLILYIFWTILISRLFLPFNNLISHIKNNHVSIHLIDQELIYRSANSLLSHSCLGLIY